MNPERFEQVDRVLQSVLERHAQERDAFLDKAWGTDALLESEVRSLLAARGLRCAGKLHPTAGGPGRRAVDG